MPPELQNYYFAQGSRADALAETAASKIAGILRTDLSGCSSEEDHRVHTLHLVVGGTRIGGRNAGSGMVDGVTKVTQ